MRLISFQGGFGRVEGDDVIPMGIDLVAYLNGEQPNYSASRPISDLVVLPAIPRPEKIICVGLNYREHAEESGQKPPEEPVLFAKFNTSLIGQRAPIRLPAVAPERVDYEAELAVVIGRRAARVQTGTSMEFVAGCLF